MVNTPYKADCGLYIQGCAHSGARSSSCAQGRTVLIDWSQALGIFLKYLGSRYGRLLHLNGFDVRSFAYHITWEISEEECQELVEKYETEELEELAEWLLEDFEEDLRVFMFRFFLKIMGRNCTRIIVAQDCPRRLNRKISADATYKASKGMYRKMKTGAGKVHCNMRAFIPLAQRCLDDFNSALLPGRPVFEVIKVTELQDAEGEYGLEADHIIGAFCQKEQGKVVIYSNDSDFLTLLVYRHVRLFRFCYSLGRKQAESEEGKKCSGIIITEATFPGIDYVVPWLGMMKGVSDKSPEMVAVMDSIRAGHFNSRAELEKSLSTVGLSYDHLCQLGEKHKPISFPEPARTFLFNLFG